MKLGELCEVVRGSSPRPKDDKRFYGGNVPRLMVADLTRDGKFVTPKIDFLTEEGAKKSRPMKKGDVVIAVSGNPGLPAILNIDACIHDGFVGLRNLNTSKITVDYLYRFLVFSKDITNFGAVGAIFKNLTTEQIRDIDVPLPPLAEQKRIAEVLDKADALREKRRRALQKLDTLLQSVFLEMFGDPVKNPKGWEKVLVGDVCKTTSGGTPKRDVADYYNGNISWVKSGELKDSIIKKTEEHISKLGLDKSSAKLVPKGTLLIALYGATVGKLGILDIEATTNQAVCAIFPSELVHQKYLFHYLFKIRNELIKKSVGGAQPNISQEIIRNLEIPLPPIELQQKFSQVVDKIETLKNETIKSVEKTQNLFQSLQQKAFKGELFGGDSADELTDEKKVWQQTSLF